MARGPAVTPSSALRLAIEQCDADLSNVRRLLSLSSDADAIGALASLATGLRLRRRQLLEQHSYAVARELADLTPCDWQPARARPVFGALMGKPTIDFHSNWRVTK